jgi:putative hydrolase of the HAD superfamily
MPDAPIRAVLLDLDDTILEDDVATEIAFRETAALAHDRAGVDPEALIAAVLRESAALWNAGPHPAWCHGIGTSEVEGLRARFEGEHPHWVEMRAWGPGFRFGSWRNALAALGVEDDALAQDLDTRFFAVRTETNPWVDGGEAAMDALAARYRLGMVTNGIPDVQRAKIDRTGLAERFDVVLVSGELGFGKPDSRIYATAVERIGVPAAESIMVGDNIRRDVGGAQAQGIRGVWISMGRDLPEGAPEPWLTVRSLADLPGRLAAREG